MVDRSGSNTDYKSSEPLKTLVMLCYCWWAGSNLALLQPLLQEFKRFQFTFGQRSEGMCIRFWRCSCCCSDQCEIKIHIS